MKSEGLTAKQVEHTKAAGKRIEIAVGPPSLYLIVQPSGSKSFALRYRWNGKTSKLTLGSYPAMSLAAARGEAVAALEALSNGKDPAAAKIEEKQAEPGSAEAVADEWLLRDVARTRTAAETERILRKQILPICKHKLITEITRADVLRALDAIMDRGAPIAANHALEIVKRWLNWCVERGYLAVSPADPLRAPAPKKSRDRVLTDAELRGAWNAAGEMGYPNGAFLRLLILLAQRRGEVAGMRWEDVDIERALWTLPAEQTKAGRIHDVPLSDPAIEAIRGLPRFEGPYVFSSGSGAKPINGFSKLATRLAAETGDTGYTIHDIRRTAATYMAKSGVPPHVVAAILNHSPGSQQGITAIYNRHRYSEERREALEAWGKHVLEVAAQKAKQRRTA